MTTPDLFKGANIFNGFKPGLIRIVWFMLLSIAVHFLSAQYIAVGNYVGNGTSNTEITGIGFAPDVVLIKGNSNTDPVIKTNTMAGQLSRRMTVNASAETNRITALLADGFRLSNINTVNEAGTDYYWVAFKNVPGKIFTGSYTGNGIDNRNITGIGFSPDYVILVPQIAQQSLMRFSSNPSGDVSFFFNNEVRQSNSIQALLPDGFQVGTSPSSNQSGAIYHYVAFKEDGANIVVDKYTGDGDDDRFISTELDPIFLIVKSYENRSPYTKIATLCGDGAFNFTNQDEYVNNIQEFGSGGFEIGSDNSVNQAGSEYYYFAVSGALRGTNCYALPVELSTFEGRASGGSVVLQWTTASEINNDYFDVQRSLDALDWETIGRVDGNGNSTSLINYQFTDKAPPAGLIYYRLKQVDHSSVFSYTDIIRVEFENEALNIRIYPNPGSSSINVRNADYPVLVSVFGANGNKYMEKELKTSTEELNVSALPKGLYLVTIQNDDNIGQVKFLKN